MFPCFLDVFEHWIRNFAILSLPTITPSRDKYTHRRCPYGRRIHFARGLHNNPFERAKSAKYSNRNSKKKSNFEKEEQKLPHMTIMCILGPIQRSLVTFKYAEMFFFSENFNNCLGLGSNKRHFWLILKHIHWVNIIVIPAVVDGVGAAGRCLDQHDIFLKTSFDKDKAQETTQKFENRRTRTRIHRPW